LAFSRRELSIQRTSPEEWSVLEGAKRPLSAPAFATLIADPITEQALAQEKKRATIAEKSFRFGGSAIATAGLVSLIGMPSVTTPQGEDRVWTALFLGGTGLMAIIIAPRAIEGLAAAQMELDRYYTPDQAGEHIAAYTRGLKSELGLLIESAEEAEADEDILRELLEPEQLQAEEDDASEAASRQDAEMPDPTAPAEAPQ
jgi:hypothetical protein